MIIQKNKKAKIVTTIQCSYLIVRLVHKGFQSKNCINKKGKHKQHINIIRCSICYIIHHNPFITCSFFTVIMQITFKTIFDFISSILKDEKTRRQPYQRSFPLLLQCLFQGKNTIKFLFVAMAFLFSKNAIQLGK